jgi:putative membrane protein
MILEIIIAIILGVFSGTLTGLIPGLHINLVAIFILSLSTLKSFPTALVVFIVALSITHTFIDFIPSIFLGAASEDTSLSILPGHKFLLQGEGEKALRLTLLGSSIAIFVLLIIIPIFFLTLNFSYPFIQRMMGWILIMVILFLFHNEENKKWSLIIFFLAGVLGTITLNSNTTAPLLPLLTGLFGSSTLINSISQKTKIPKQKSCKFKIQKKDLIKPTLLTTLISPVCSFLPGLGSSQAAILATRFSKKTSTEEFLILQGSINTLVIATSFITYYLIGKTRTGSAAAISEITTLTPSLLFIIILTIVISAAISYPLTLFLTRTIAKRIHKANYFYISASILVFLTSAVIFFTGFSGLLIYSTATSLGLLTIKAQVRKSHLMGAILIPTTLFYLAIL